MCSWEIPLSDSGLDWPPPGPGPNAGSKRRRNRGWGSGSAFGVDWAGVPPGPVWQVVTAECPGFGWTYVHVKTEGEGFLSPEDAKRQAEQQVKAQVKLRAKCGKEPGKQCDKGNLPCRVRWPEDKVHLVVLQCERLYKSRGHNKNKFRCDHWFVVPFTCVCASLKDLRDDGYPENYVAQAAAMPSIPRPNALLASRIPGIGLTDDVTQSRALSTASPYLREVFRPAPAPRQVEAFGRE
jgi:hypothetical protein